MTKNKTLAINSLILIAVVALSLVLYMPKSQAATFSIASGTDTKAADGKCHLSEAIENINDQAQTNADCAAGTGNDIIQLPEGTITLSADLPVLTRSVTVQGHGIGKSVIDAEGQYYTFIFNSPTADLTFNDFTIKSITAIAISGPDAKSISINNIEMDGEGAVSRAFPGDDSTKFLSGFGYLGAGTEPAKISINGLYIHDLESNDASFLTGIMLKGPATKIQEVYAKNVTISGLKLDSPDGQLIGIMNSGGFGDDSYSSVKATYENITIHDITAVNALNTGAIVASNVIANGDSVGEFNIKNATISKIRGKTSPFGASAGISMAGMAAGELDSVTFDIKLQNVLFADTLVDGEPSSCASMNINEPLGGSGTVTQTFHSLGGNIIDNDSCKTILTDDTDQNGVKDLKNTLGSLESNEGAIPSIALKAGSPAIDAGVCDGAPTSDVRGVARPQGSSCDAGAYEAKQAVAAGVGGVINPATGKKVFIEFPITGAIVKSADVLPGTDAKDDEAYEYPLGLLGYTIEGIEEGSSQIINLYFETDEKADNFVARKLDLSNKRFSTIEGAKLSNVTKEGKPAIRLSYEIKDGGPLDLDGEANGQITDPVALALQKPEDTLVNTGTTTIITSLLGGLLIAGVLLVNLDYRKHKAPLVEVYPNLAKDYTFWHHVRVVTIPTLKYRFTIVIDRKSTIQ